jgi:hypothetical protein
LPAVVHVLSQSLSSQQSKQLRANIDIVGQ